MLLLSPILFMPKRIHVLHKPQRNSNHLGIENTNIKKVKTVPIRDNFSFPKPIHKIGWVKNQPIK